MNNRSVLVRIPATVGSFGGAINCAAMALDASLNVKATPRVDGVVGIRYFGEDGERVPRDRSNLVVRAMESAVHLRQLEFSGADFEIYSSVPVGVGLGSSTAAVLAGLIAADGLFRLKLDETTMLELAAIHEPRTDNLRAAWFGGLVTSAEGEPLTAQRRSLVPGNLVLHVIVPEPAPEPGVRNLEFLATTTPTDDPRVCLERAAALVMSLTAGECPLLTGTLPAATQKVPLGFEDALGLTLPGAYAIFICGSGPAVGILCNKEGTDAVGRVRACLTRRGVSSTLRQFNPINVGARDWNALFPEVALPAVTRLDRNRKNRQELIVISV